jgi:hypothetical protein
MSSIFGGTGVPMGPEEVDGALASVANSEPIDGEYEELAQEDNGPDEAEPDMTGLRPLGLLRDLFGLFTQEEMSQLLNIKLSTLGNWRRTGQGPVFVVLGRRVYYRMDDVHKWIAEQPAGKVEDVPRKPRGRPRKESTPVAHEPKVVTGAGASEPPAGATVVDKPSPAQTQGLSGLMATLAAAEDPEDAKPVEEPRILQGGGLVTMEDAGGALDYPQPAAEQVPEDDGLDALVGELLFDDGDGGNFDDGAGLKPVDWEARERGEE